MPRTPESSFQLAFEFGQKSETCSIKFDTGVRLFDNLAPREPGLERFMQVIEEPIALLTPTTAAEYLMTHVYHPFEECLQEELWALLLDTKNNMTHAGMLYRGSINMVQIRPAEVFRAAVKANSPSLLLAHNHPTGDPSPSPEDVGFSKHIVEAGRILDINVIDHLVIGKESFVSMKERGLGF